MTTTTIRTTCGSCHVAFEVPSTSLVLALLLVRRVVASLHGLQALGQGSGSAEPLPTAGLREVDDAARALAEAHQRQAGEGRVIRKARRSQREPTFHERPCGEAA